MKTAKEWAESVVVAPNPDAGETMSLLRDVDDDDVSVYLQYQTSWHAEAESVNAARGIIERLVDRAQDDMLDEFATYFREQERSLYDGERLDFDYCIARFRERIGGDK